MIFFAVIGFAFYVMFCFQVGYTIGMVCDADAHIDQFFKPVMSELDVLMAMFPLSRDREDERGRGS